jgi:ribosomal protein L16 Arg81 hydroxylase
MNLQTLLGETPLPRFVADHYYKLPYSSAGTAQAFCELGSWESLTTILAQETVDVFVCRRNEQYNGLQPRSADEARRLTDEGYTLLVKHAERHDERLGAVAASFERDLGAPVNIHMYCTPGGEYGFGWHYDAEEVFIVQTTGRKEYSLRKNTVNPWPLEETLPADMKYEREIMPLVRCELAAGDSLYIPSGYWHMGQSRETAISLAIGVMPHTAVEIFDRLRSHVLDSLLWRQRMPVVGSASPISESELRGEYQRICQELGQDLVKHLSSPRLVDDLLANINAKR